LANFFLHHYIDLISYRSILEILLVCHILLPAQFNIPSVPKLLLILSIELPSKYSRYMRLTTSASSGTITSFLFSSLV